MRLSLSLCFISVLFLLASHASSCTPFADVVSSEQRRYITYQQRGLSGDFTEPFYGLFLSDIYVFVQGRYKDPTFTSICLTARDLTEFYGNVHDSYAIDRELVSLKARFPNMAYLSRSEKQFIQKDSRFERASSEMFNKTYKKLCSGDFQGAAELPRTSEVLYDPAQGTNLEVYQAHASHAPTMSALRALCMVTGMVVSLELAEVSRKSSTQLLRHAVAWLSTVFRGVQRDGADVEVPVLFTPFYREEFERLLAYGRHKVGLVGEREVEKMLGKQLRAYCRLDAWGRLKILRWNGLNTAEIWTIEEELFDADLLAQFAKMIAFDDFDKRNYPPYDGHMDRLDGWETKETTVDGSSLDGYEGRTFAEVSHNTMIPAVRQGACHVPLYEFHPRSGVPWEQKCCAAICCNSVLMLQASLSTEECCQDCNQALCHIGTSLAELAMVHLEPYGSYTGGYVPVAL